MRLIRKRRGMIVVFLGIVTALAVSASLDAVRAAGEETYKGLKRFATVLEIVERNYVDPVDGDKLIDGALGGMLQSLDPHSAFLSPEAYRDLQVDTQGEFGGLGIVVALKEGYITVVAPVEGTPADKAGIRSGDRILKVDGVSTQEMKLWEAVDKMRGQKGTKVVLTVYREGFDEPREYTLVRDIIPIFSVRSLMVKPGYGYLRISNFQDNTTSDVKKALDELESGKPPLKGLVIDLRNNPGGLLTQCIAVADFFIDQGEIVSIKGRKKENNRVYRARKDSVNRDYPIVVLINSGTASASEILAGALQDHKKAVLMGTTSFGKGSVQSVEPLPDGYAMKLTIARYYTPSGRSIQAEGIVPDIEVQDQPDAGDDEEKTEAKPVKKRDSLRERDLMHHLEPGSKDKKDAAKPGDKLKAPDAKPADAKPADVKPGAKPETAPNGKSDETKDEKFGQISVNKLMGDTLVVRALDLLQAHSVFSGAK